MRRPTFGGQPHGRLGDLVATVKGTPRAERRGDTADLRTFHKSVALWWASEGGRERVGDLDTAHPLTIDRAWQFTHDPRMADPHERRPR